MDVRVRERTLACKGEAETKLSFYMNGVLVQDEIYFDIKFDEKIPQKKFNTHKNPDKKITESCIPITSSLNNYVLYSLQE